MTKHSNKNYCARAKPIVKKTRELEEVEAFIFSLGKLKFALRKNNLYHLAVHSFSLIYYSSRKHIAGFSFIDADFITLIDLIKIWRNSQN